MNYTQHGFDVVHATRTPLNFLYMGTQLVAEGCGTEENRDLVRRMESAVEQMGAADR